jgi:hypothetical protein
VSRGPSAPPRPRAPCPPSWAFKRNRARAPSVVANTVYWTPSSTASSCVFVRCVAAWRTSLCGGWRLGHHGTCRRVSHTYPANQPHMPQPSNWAQRLKSHPHQIVHRVRDEAAFLKMAGVGRWGDEADMMDEDDGDFDFQPDKQVGLRRRLSPSGGLGPPLKALGRQGDGAQVDRVTGDCARGVWASRRGGSRGRAKRSRDECGRVLCWWAGQEDPTDVELCMRAGCRPPGCLQPNATLRDRGWMAGRETERLCRGGDATDAPYSCRRPCGDTDTRDGRSRGRGLAGPPLHLALTPVGGGVVTHWALAAGPPCWLRERRTIRRTAMTCELLSGARVGGTGVRAGRQGDQNHH